MRVGKQRESEETQQVKTARKEEDASLARRGLVAHMCAAVWPLLCRVLPKTGNQKGNFVVVTMGCRREILFDLLV